MNKYIAILHGRQVVVEADSAWEGKQKALAILKPRKKDLGLVAFGLAELRGKPYVHTAVN